MKNIVNEMIDAAKKSCEEIKENIEKVFLNDDGNKIQFTLNGSIYVGELKGRNADAWVLGDDCPADKSLALKVLLDGDAKKIL